MKIDRLWIEGYGRFSTKKVEFCPGLQIVAGPNEQGKTTLREFIADALYGQPQSGNGQEGPDKRTPWNSENGYGGRINYVLDDGTGFELRRDFQRNSGILRAVNGKRGETRRLKLDDPSFEGDNSVEEHLGISRKVFLSVATITHQTLDSLGDDAALATIRDRLLSLTDVGAASNSTEGALTWLRERMETIGRPNSTARPLPRARERSAELQRELEHCLAKKAEITKLEEDRRGGRKRIEESATRQRALQRELRALEKFERMQRLSRAEELSRRIDALTKNSFMLAAARDFPLGRVQEAEHAVVLMATAEEKTGNIQSELDTLQVRLSRARKRLDPGGSLVLEDIDPDYENRLAECETRIYRLNDRINELNVTREEIEQRHADAEEELNELPDFSRHAAEPVEWLTGLASSFEATQRTLDDRKARLARLTEDFESKQAERAEAHEWFQSVDDFHTEAREYGVRTKEIEETLRRLDETEVATKVHAAELQSKVPGFAFIAALGTTGVFFLVIAALYLGNVGIYVPAAFAFAVLSYAALGVYFCRRGVRKARRDLERVRQKTAEARLADMNARELIEGLMRDARCQTIWELEAAYDRYREDSMELSMLEGRIEEQGKRCAEAQEHADESFTNMRETFLQLGEEVSAAADVFPASRRAIGRYQAYRDAKRRASETREALSRIDVELKPLKDEREEYKKTELQLSLEVRQLLRDYHYHEEEKCDSALKALQGYRLRVAQMRQSRREVDVLKGRVAEKAEQLEAERRSFVDHLNKLNELLEEGNVNSIDEYRDRAMTARKYHEEWKERASLEEQLNTVLEGRDPIQIRHAIDTEEVEAEKSERSAEDLRAELDAVTAELEQLRQEDHALHVAIAELGTGLRPLNEIEEEQSTLAKQAASLELELQAASYAASIIEEVADERHARLAPKLEKLASAYLEEITSGTYKEIKVSRDLGISVRIPQTDAIDGSPERRLSKGTVDQIYLALRLAMVRAVSASGERIPMLLDDPFANYDDLRLARAMTLLAHIAEDNQILLFTCRDDVVRAAREIELPIIRL